MTRAPSQLGGDRRHDLGQVADHGVVGAGEDRRLGVGVDREDLLRALAAGDVLGGAADAAGDVEVGRDLRAGLADLVGVRAPAGARHDARAADRARRAGPASSSRIAEALGRADAAAAADDDLRLGERDAGRRLVDVLDDLHGQVGVAERRRERLDRRRARRLGGRRRRAARPRAAAARAWMRASSSRLPPQRDPRDRVAAVDGGAVRREGQVAPRGRRAPSPRCPRSVPGGTTAVGDSALDQLVDSGGPGAPARRRRCRSATWARSTGTAELRAATRRRRHRRAAPANVSACRDSSSSAAVDQHQHRHQATPSSRITSTTAGAASGPWPRISACLPWPGGTTSRSFSSRGSGRAGVSVSTGFCRARSFAGTDG